MKYSFNFQAKLRSFQLFLNMKGAAAEQYCF